MRVPAVVRDHSALFPVALGPPTPDNVLGHVGPPLGTSEDRRRGTSGTFLGPPRHCGLHRVHRCGFTGERSVISAWWHPLFRFVVNFMEWIFFFFQRVCECVYRSDWAVWLYSAGWAGPAWGLVWA